MHSIPSSSSGESENEINANDAPPLLASVQSDDKHESGSEDNDGFTVVIKKKRVPPIFIDESINTPELLKELSEKTGTKVPEKWLLKNNTPLNRLPLKTTAQ
ncbi:hypothetical protein NPIL_100381 [Nephila pilipes]|uniref:Uncharacterized protein n=1 Tax=Nephila pilipes TaxID=299642 RepID=A0A8X6MPC2_NEPPI|nr:hypothetical protein NPIL_100381 [Nephila pilipes]